MYLIEFRLTKHLKFCVTSSLQSLPFPSSRQLYALIPHLFQLILQDAVPSVKNVSEVILWKEHIEMLGRTEMVRSYCPLCVDFCRYLQLWSEDIRDTAKYMSIIRIHLAENSCFNNCHFITRWRMKPKWRSIRARNNQLNFGPNQSMN